MGAPEESVTSGKGTSSTSRVTVANGFTLLRVALVPVVAVLVAQESQAARWWATAVFCFAAFTDGLDGYVARRTGGGVTRWGQLADPLADKLLIVGALVVAAWQLDVPWWAVAVIAVREIAITALRSFLVRRDVVMPADRFGKAKTVAQIVYVALVLAPGTPATVTTVMLWVVLLLTLGSGLAYGWRAVRR